MKKSKRNSREQQVKATRKAAAVRALSDSSLKPVKGGARPPAPGSDPIC